MIRVADHYREMDKIKNAFQSQIERLKNEHTAYVQELINQHEHQITKIRTNHGQEVIDIRQRMSMVNASTYDNSEVLHKSMKERIENLEEELRKSKQAAKAALDEVDGSLEARNV